MPCILLGSWSAQGLVIPITTPLCRKHSETAWLLVPLDRATVATSAVALQDCIPALCFWHAGWQEIWCRALHQGYLQHPECIHAGLSRWLRAAERVSCNAAQDHSYLLPWAFHKPHDHEPGHFPNTEACIITFQTPTARDIIEDWARHCHVDSSRCSLIRPGLCQPFAKSSCSCGMGNCFICSVACRSKMDPNAQDLPCQQMQNDQLTLHLQSCRQAEGSSPCTEMKLREYAAWWRLRKSNSTASAAPLYLKDWHFASAFRGLYQVQPDHMCWCNV